MAVTSIRCTTFWQCNYCGGVGPAMGAIPHHTTCDRGDNVSESRSATPVTGYYAIEVDGRRDDRHEHW